MGTNPQRFPNSPGVTQSMYIILPADQFFALARANMVRGTIGSTNITFSDDEHRDLRTLFIATVCGVSN
ncbi:MAG: hypothetical protein ABI679_15640 [Gemmatimonadota bacterium]